MFLLEFAEPGGDGENFCPRALPEEMVNVLEGREVLVCRSGGDKGGMGTFDLLGSALFLLYSREYSSKEFCLKLKDLLLWDLMINIR
jgi:hypothetical protein